MNTTTHIDRIALLGAVGVALLALILAAMHAIQPELNPVEDFVSEYAYGPLGWLIMVGYSAAGIGTALIAWRLLSLTGSGRWTIVSAVALLAVAAGLVATGLTRIDLSGSDGTVVSTTSGQLHELVGYVAVFGLIAAALAIPAAFRRNTTISEHAAALRLYGWILVAAFIGSVLAQPLGVPGLGQRVFLGVSLSWLVFVGIALSGVSREWRAGRVARRMSR